MVAKKRPVVLRGEQQSIKVYSSSDNIVEAPSAIVANQDDVDDDEEKDTSSRVNQQYSS